MLSKAEAEGMVVAMRMVDVRNGVNSRRGIQFAPPSVSLNRVSTAVLNNGNEDWECR